MQILISNTSGEPLYEQIENQIKNAITEKGVSISDTDSFRSYASKIKQIEGSGGSEDTFLNLRTNGGITGSALFAYAPKEICNESLTNFIKKIDTSNIFLICFIIQNLKNCILMNGI